LVSAWLIQQEGIIAIAKASNPPDVKENSAACIYSTYSRRFNRKVDIAFPSPNCKMA